MSRSASDRRRRQGFTLLEVLLALALLTVLLLGLTSAIALHLRAFDTGRSDVTQAQLARALLQRMAADLTNVTPVPAGAPHAPPPASPHPGEGGAAGLETDVAQAPGPRPPSWVLSGERQHLRLVARRGRQAWPAEETVTDSESAAADGGLALVHYRWLTETEAGAGEAATASFEAPQPGLTRTAAAWLPEVGEAPADSPEKPVEGTPPFTPNAPLAGDSATPRRGSPSSLSGSREPSTQHLATSASGPDQSLGPVPVDLGELHVPEVADVNYRFFDGRAWHSSWPAPGSGPLPRAVEIRLALADPAEAKQWREAGGVFGEEEVRTASPADEWASDSFSEPATPGDDSGINRPIPGSPWARPAGGDGPELARPDGKAAPGTSASAPGGRPARSTIQVYRRVVILPAGTPPPARATPPASPATRTAFTP